MAAGMGDETRRFSSGHRWLPTATVLNGWQDAADYVRDLERGGGAPGVPSALIQGCVIPVKNNSGGDRARFDVVGIDTPIIGPADNLALFTTRPGLIGVSPTLANHLGKFAVFLRPAAQGKMAPALISGVVPCKVKIQSTASNPLTGQPWYPYADIEDSTLTRLILRPYGAAQILWKASAASGDQWAIVRIGNPGGIVTLRGTLSAALSPAGYADAALTYNGASYTQRVYDYLMKTGATAIASGKKILATYFPDEQKFYAVEAECP
jgi:hypothetical protein